MSVIMTYFNERYWRFNFQNILSGPWNPADLSAGTFVEKDFQTEFILPIGR